MMSEQDDLTTLRGSKDLWAMPSPEFEGRFDAALARIEARGSHLREALRGLIGVTDALLDAGNPQDWRPVSSAVNRARNALTQDE